MPRLYVVRPTHAEIAGDLLLQHERNTLNHTQPPAPGPLPPLSGAILCTLAIACCCPAAALPPRAAAVDPRPLRAPWRCLRKKHGVAFSGSGGDGRARERCRTVAARTLSSSSMDAEDVVVPRVWTGGLCPPALPPHRFQTAATPVWLFWRCSTPPRSRSWRRRRMGKRRQCPGRQ